MTIKKWILSLVLVIAGGSSVTGVLFGSSGSLSVAMVRPPATATTSLWSCDWKKTCAIGMVAVTGVGMLGRMFISWNNLQKYSNRELCENSKNIGMLKDVDPITREIFLKMDGRGQRLALFENLAKSMEFERIQGAFWHHLKLKEKVEVIQAAGGCWWEYQTLGEVEKEKFLLWLEFLGGQEFTVIEKNNLDKKLKAGQLSVDSAGTGASHIVGAQSKSCYRADLFLEPESGSGQESKKLQEFKEGFTLWLNGLKIDQNASLHLSTHLNKYLRQGGSMEVFRLKYS